MVVLGVDLVAAFHQNDLRAHPLGIGDDSAGAHAKSFGFVAGGNADGRIGHHRHHADWPPAKLRPDLLLHRRKVGVQINEEPVQQGSVSGISGRDRFGGSSSFRILRRIFRSEAKVGELLRPLVRGCRRRGIGMGSHFLLPVSSPFICYFAS